ncbi:MAG: P-type conjugative transfer protein TrbJ [Robiginitomaculum sp.]|nr:P-type conjugative transfer protein TrbJ [Robiginitomaculum sp.]
MRRRIKSTLLTGIMMLSFAQAAQDQFGGIVFDPKNFVQNLYTASRSLIQIRQQVSQLQNEARMLIGQAKNLAKMDYNAQYELLRILQEIAVLTEQAENVSYEVGRSRQLMRDHYPQEYADMSDEELVQNAEVQWENSRVAFEEAIVMQSKIVGSGKVESRTLDKLVGESQSSTGNLSVVQAGNQLLALLIKQIMQMQQMDAVQYRAQALEHARQLAIEKESRQKHKRFVGSKKAYGKRGK